MTASSAPNKYRKKDFVEDSGRGDRAGWLCERHSLRPKLGGRSWSRERQDEIIDTPYAVGSRRSGQGSESGSCSCLQEPTTRTRHEQGRGKRATGAVRTVTKFQQISDWHRGRWSTASPVKSAGCRGFRSSFALQLAAVSWSSRSCGMPHG